ncbi:putative 2cyclic-nucleotide 3phosphodiesterase [Echria macrotheca]|uniref:2cyclic-nucleotide 3phosphodiesterase n=1 Tax=Echria macrotheca TaxID=438768 RepID=A0AAJ0BCF2_9PEZI|nr:putative 2cyclic-nucleotide 3phosphodiesterase [Echria macrotheca]
MPGSSIWLLPPPTHHLHEKLKTLIAETLPALFPAESTSATLSPDFFVPHVTLTSEISPDLYGSDPQGWLDSIPWPAADEVCVRFEELRSQDVFVRRCYIGVGFDGVKDIAALARARGVLGEETPADKTAAWLKSWQDAFGPHVSLM